MAEKKETILITGARGAIAKHLSALILHDYHIKFLTRKKTHDNEYSWDLKTKNIDRAAFKDVDHIIHLSGAHIADKRWTAKRKIEIMSSRVDSAKLILETLKENRIKIDSFISASAVGYYGAKTSDSVFSEQDEGGVDFLSAVCHEWEKIAERFASENAARRTVILRFGIVLSKNEGVLPKMNLPVRLNLGAYFGNGSQFMPWIHIEDLCAMLQFVLKHKAAEGKFNAVAPEHVTNKIFTDCLAQCLHKRIWLPNIPSFMIRLLFGESSILLLEGSRISSQKITEAGFRFKYPALKTALENLLA